MCSTTDRLERALQNRKEEQVIAAILHMSSPWGFIALISSGIVWATSRSRSRFLSIQALQAFLFQLVSLLAFGLMFLIFMAGFYYTMFSGLIARTGADEPELTSNLIIAAVIGFAVVFFFRLIFPLWGIWAGIQILRGHGFQYPVLGKLVIRWISRQPFILKTESHVQHSPEPDNGRVIAGLGHASILIGFSLFLSPILWAANRSRSQFLSHNLLQAGIFQMVVTMLITISFFVVWGSLASVGVLQAFGITSSEFMAGVSEFIRITYFPFGLGILFALFLLTSGIYIIIATIQAFRGKEFNYPFIGKRLLHYIQSASNVE